MDADFRSHESELKLLYANVHDVTKLCDGFLALSAAIAENVSSSMWRLQNS
jgi:hypothetical protein